MSDPRSFLVNLDYEPGDEFMRALLSTAEFSLAVCRKLGLGKPGKDDRVDALFNHLKANPEFAEDVLVRLCQAPRTWLYLALLPNGATPDTSSGHGTAHEFLTRFGKNRQWYGPFTDDTDPDHTWYVRTASIRHYIEESKFEGDENPKMVPKRVRWHVVALVGKGYVALHWNNFSHVEKNSESAGHSGEQFPYWKHIPGVRDELLSLLGLDDAEVEEPVLYDLVLNQLLEKFEPDPAFEWKHLRVRAEQFGVAMNARSASAKASEHDLGGVRKLTHAFATSAAAAIDQEDDETVSAIERALLRTFIREWGTVSYEFELNKQPASPGEKETKIFRGHVYFGERNQDAGPDGLPHCKCFQQWGGSNGVMKFILEHL